MGSDDDMFRIWSGPEGSSHKEPLSGIRIHRVRRHSRVADQNRLKGHIYLIIESLALCRSLALPKHRLLHALGASERRPYICNELLTHLQGSPYYHESD